MSADGQERSRRLCVYSLSFLRARRIRRILRLAGLRVTTGWPSASEAVGVWGNRPTARRGAWIARQSRAQIIRLEDGFLRSIASSGSVEPPISLIVDDVGIYYDARRPSRLENLLEQTDLSASERARAGACIGALRAQRISKYTPPLPLASIGAGYVLVIDQTRGDASIAGAGADADTFKTMLAAARSEYPNADLVIKSHPDVTSGKRLGHFATGDLSVSDRLQDTDFNPWDVIENASCVYTVSSQMGYEAILAGKPVRCFGKSFFSGWGLTHDEARIPRRTARLDAKALFHGCHLSYPIYYDPWRDKLGDFETALSALSHQRDAAMPADGASGDVYLGVRQWKRSNLARFRPRQQSSPLFASEAAKAIQAARRDGRELWCWASKTAPEVIDRARALDVEGGFIEDGFLRSVGLGAALTEAASLVFDRKGIYFDPSRPSDLEEWIARAADGASDKPRAASLRAEIVAAGISKYNTGSRRTDAPPPDRHVILVPGQVEDDASILRGCTDVATNLGLLSAARAANPDAWIIYKPHPDVEAGLRAGAVPQEDALKLADCVAADLSASASLESADEVWTLTSLLGFEALLRGLPVTCLGAPFYAGWGLTTDLGPPTPRRSAKPDIDDLVWAALIAYPQYREPVSGLPCPVEVVVERLARGTPFRRANALSRLQRLFARQSWLWR